MKLPQGTRENHRVRAESFRMEKAFEITESNEKQTLPTGKRAQMTPRSLPTWFSMIL